ncbi:MAG: glycosyltransferase [Gammaproteobacteria bacterium]|nr:glycosyltransferase [Gammaproteobacteria bacterium]
MKISGFSFIRNGQKLGFPFIQSIQSILPICDEFIINVGNSDDETLTLLKNLNEPKLKIIETTWNDHMRSKGYVYGQQKMIAQFSCTGDWAFYIEGDEVVHEEDLPKIKEACAKYLEDPRVEALTFDYLHFYGNLNTHLWSPGWYRRAPRLIKTSVRSYAPDGLFWLVLDKSNKKGRYPYAASTGAKMYHYGWVRPESKMVQKLTEVEHLWNKQDQARGLKYENIDPKILKSFNGTHPKVIEGFFSAESGLFKANPKYVLNRRDKRHRISMFFERIFNLDFSRKHFRKIRAL